MMKYYAHWYSLRQKKSVSLKPCYVSRKNFLDGIEGKAGKGDIGETAMEDFSQDCLADS